MAQRLALSVFAVLMLACPADEPVVDAGPAPTDSGPELVLDASEPPPVDAGSGPDASPIDTGPQRDRSCDDQGGLGCGEREPDCPAGTIPAIKAGCWTCVNPETCWPEDLRREYCDDGSDLQCRMAVPDCPEGEIAAIIEGCYLCVDEESCVPSEPARLDRCDDGSELICDMTEPECRLGVAAIQDGCYVCVREETCMPRGEGACEADADCPPTHECHHCAHSSCLTCEDCVQACTPHLCETEQVLECRCARPECEHDQLSIIQDGCWVCVDSYSCEPVPGACHDG